MKRATVLATCQLSLLLNGLLLCGSEPEAKRVKPTAEQIEFFEKRVRPVLVEHCNDCHCEDMAESELQVDSLAGLLTGGTRGPALVIGQPEKSLLISAVTHSEVLQMPPKEKLSQRQIADLSAWVKMGAPWPNAQPVAIKKQLKDLQPQYTDEQKNFWAFQTPVAVAPPTVKNGEWVHNPIDNFILAALEAKGLKPAPQADRRTLIRRATFDLIGLPPTPVEIDEFLADETPGAYRRLIERLLASPHYGERWGRHWLDVARYADSNGMDENMAFASAFRYRDYVIAAFNKDKPYDRFLHEQLAGDLLRPEIHETEADNYERLIATGFLAIGPKMLADDDPVKKQMDIIDEQIDTTCRALMGLTMGCTRCHAHKFDPFPISDYYALAGIFKSTKTMEDFGVVANWHEFEIPTEGERAAVAIHTKKVASLVQRLTARTKAAREEFLTAERVKAGRYLLAASQYLHSAGDVLPDGRSSIGDLVTAESLQDRGVLREAESFQRGTVQVDTESWGKNVGVLLQSGFAEYDIELSRAGRYQLELRYAAHDPRPLEISINSRKVKTDGASGATGGWFAADQQWHLEGVYEFQAGRNVVRLERVDVFPHVDKLMLVALPELTDPKQLAVAVNLSGETSGAIVVEAENYTRGTLKKRGPVVLNSGDGAFFNEAEYDIEIPADGSYQLDLLYASGEARSFQLSIDDQRVNDKAANKTTGGFDDGQVKWFAEGIYRLEKGRVTIRIEQRGPTPHLDRLALVPTELPPTVLLTERPEGSRGTREWSKDLSLNEVILKEWIKHLRKESAEAESFWRQWIADQSPHGIDVAVTSDPTATSPSLSLRDRAAEYQELFERAEVAWNMMTVAGKKAEELSDLRLKAFASVMYDNGGLFALTDRPERFYSAGAKAEIERMTKEKTDLEAAKPQFSQAMGVKEGNIQNVRIHLRGSHLSLGREVPRKFFEVIAGENQTPIDDTQSGRLQFARWLTNPEHPLTSRVMINRIWRWHFGTGLVRSPDNFGLLGEAPTNQQLLDWLAREFIHRDWSIKSMHRLIMLSAAYQMSSEYNARGAGIDPENKLYWRMDRRRMEAEEVRDSILALAGSLDIEMSGQLLRDKNRAYVTGTGSKVSTYAFNRRSVYLPVLRSAVYEVFQAFDFADPSVLNGKRATTTVTPQALFMMNSKLIAEGTGRLAANLLKRNDLDDASRVGSAFQRIYGREASESETERFLEFVHQVEQKNLNTDMEAEQARHQAWRSLCRVLIASNEFIYVE